MNFWNSLRNDYAADYQAGYDATNMQDSPDDSRLYALNQIIADGVDESALPLCDQAFLYGAYDGEMDT